MTLCVDRFWEQTFDGTSQAELDAAIAAMPAELRDEDLADPVDRARQLQWAIVATNNLSAASVAVLLPGGTYDFTGLDDAHPSVPTTDFYQLPLRPKLFIRRNDVTLRNAQDSSLPVLTASGPGADGIHHGRVFLLLDSSHTRLKVQGLVFRGDAETTTFADPAGAMHEDDASLYFTGQWGSTMVGLNGGANQATFEDCRFEKVNGSAISAVGLLTVTRTAFEGAVPEPSEIDPEDVIEALQAAITAGRGASPGMDFHSGIRRSYAYGPTVVEDSTFTGFVQGVVGSADGFPIELRGNTFTSIYDHAVYVLGDAGGSVVEDNLFEKVGNGAVKFAGHTEELDPDLGVAGLHDGAVRDNQFVQMRNGAMAIGGVRNDISGNQVAAYDASADPTGWYDPDYNPGHHYPEAFLITEAGQAGWADHIYRNRFEDNTAGDGEFSIFIQQRPNVGDRSISENTVSGAGQTVYFRHLKRCGSNPAPCSTYEPTITAEGGANLVFGAPADCADCYPSDPDYISELP
ncbi:MAG: hypothetical protein EXR71_14285 [Myxococcales bacterium]|nr:hypothetical protein [Myxococcales bacterium]